MEYFEEKLKTIIRKSKRRSDYDAHFVVDTLLYYALEIAESDYVGPDTWRHYIKRRVEYCFREP